VVEERKMAENAPTYSDEDLLNATQVAYLNFTSDEVLDYWDKHPDATIAELLTVDTSNMEFAQDQLAEAQAKLASMQAPDNHNLSRNVRDMGVGVDMTYTPAYMEAEKEVIRWEERIDLLEDIKNNENGCGDWKIVTSVNESGKEGSGFAACVIETGEGEAIVAFHGSESVDFTMFQKDWIEADFMLLNTTQTLQQARATAYMDEVVEQVANEKGYETLTFTGHSLGGNLAHHAAITAPDDLKDRIVQAYSFDGPGFSEEYHREHGNQEKSMAGKLTHYQWSPIGAIFTQMEGAFDMSISTGEYTDDRSFQKHDTCFARFGMEGGFVRKGHMDGLARIFGAGSRSIDADPDSYALLGALLRFNMLDYLFTGHWGYWDWVPSIGMTSQKPVLKAANFGGVGSYLAGTGKVGIDYEEMDALRLKLSNLAHEGDALAQEYRGLLNELRGFRHVAVDVSEGEQLVNKITLLSMFLSLHEQKMADFETMSKEIEAGFLRELEGM
jgi:pimeloyl-ACP methyl ester carboxylesterase